MQKRGERRLRKCGEEERRGEAIRYVIRKDRTGGLRLMELEERKRRL